MGYSPDHTYYDENTYDSYAQVCMCGAYMNSGECYQNGHSPVSVRDYYNQQNKEKKTMSTNYSTAVMLFNSDIRAVRVSYDPKDLVSGKPRDYLFKTLDPDIKAGDYVSIPTDSRHNMTIGKVEEVDSEVDFDADIELKWIISRVPTDGYEAILKDEQAWIAEMKKAQIRKKKEDIKKNMLDMYQADGASLETLAIAGRKPAATCAIITDATDIAAE